ncbi:hypothetical protein FCV62_05845 [Vibrio kanaloae]|uniref:lipopolysaccharide biosynthesis protein n=1 Tax=Vibrio kanaloae TaxID=170673 RepID=UPI0010BEA17D|nr:oligosaccharide flippase family protein [Vibrio kanaloae]TKF80559.1 hypothetical protein FCV62_05845 [Vibrio kanaloae]
MNDFFKNVKALIFGVGVSKFVGILTIPLLTRLYTPEEFGILSLFNSITLIIVPFMTLRYVIAIPLPKNNQSAISILTLCLAISLISFTLLTFLAIMIDNLSVQYFEILGNYIYLLPIAAMLISSFEIVSYWLTRNEKFKVLSKCNIIQGVSGALAKILFSIIPITGFGLVIGQIVQQSNGLLTGLKSSEELRLRYVKKVKYRNVKKIFYYYSDIPKFRLISQIMLLLSMQMPIFSFSGMYNVDIVGQLSLATMLLTLPISLIGNSTGQVYYSKVSKIGKKNPEEILKLTINLTKRLFIFSVPIAFLVYILSPYAFRFAFGYEWALSGEIASILSIILVPQFLSSPIINSFNVFGKQKLSMMLNIYRAIFLIVIFYFCNILQLEAIETMKIYSYFSCFYYVFVIFLVFRVINNEIIN